MFADNYGLQTFMDNNGLQMYVSAISLTEWEGATCRERECKAGRWGNQQPETD